MSRPPARARRRLASLVALLALALAACDGAQDAPPHDGDPVPAGGPAAQAGSAVVWGHEQEPLTLNPTIEEGNTFVTTQVALATVLPLWTITPELDYQPTALLERAEPRTAGGRFSVTYELNPAAEWSDGTPITAGDVFFTLQTCLDPRWAITNRAGCEAVDMAGTAEDLDPGSKTIEVRFLEEHAAWQTLFSTADGVILPAHILEGQDWDAAWATDLPIASGPFRFDGWEPGRQLTLVRNEQYAGEPAALDRLVFAFLPDSDAAVEALQAGEIDLFAPPPEVELIGRLEAVDGLALQTGPGTVWEHLSFRLDRPPLGDRDVRQALSMAIDREAIVAEVAAPVDPDAEPLDSLVHLHQQAEYEDHLSAHVAHDPAGAVALLQDHGCTRGDEAIFSCAGALLSLTLTTTRGDERRERTAELLAAQLEAVGVEVVHDRREPAVLFGDGVLAAGGWDLTTFAWVGGPDPGSNVALWSCGGAQNHTGHCDERVTSLLAASERETDPEERARLVNRAGRLLAIDAPALPLYQRPDVLALNPRAVTGPRRNPSQWGHVWNVAAWQAVADVAGGG